MCEPAHIQGSDRYRVAWQIVPRALGEMMKDRDKTRARRVAQLMLKMVKLDITALRAAYDGHVAA